MSERELRAELRRFLKERRARIRPEDAGLPATSRRRVPGLRREEVAALAGIGVSWYTELENGDADGVSEATLHAVADALRLSPAEREYLVALSGRAQAATPSEPAPLVLATMHAISFPAYIITPTWDMVDGNLAFRRVWGIEAGEFPVNAIERLFIDPRARAMHGERYLANFKPVIAMLRSSQGRQPQVASLRAIRDRILADEELRGIWDDYEVQSPLAPNACTISTPQGEFRYETLTLPAPDRSHAIVVQVPDAPSQARWSSSPIF